MPLPPLTAPLVDQSGQSATLYAAIRCDYQCLRTHRSRMECRAKANKVEPGTLKLRLDLLGLPSLGASMDKDNDDRIRDICTRIGSIMEDASIAALIWKPPARQTVEERLNMLDDAQRAIAELVSEARSVLK